MKTHNPYYPIFLNVGGKRCVVVGGGNVALRKVEGLLRHGASVDVVSPELCDELETLVESGHINVFRRAYRPGDIEGAFLAIAATDDSLTNKAVADECARFNIIVNVVDDAALSSYISPSVLERGDLAIAVSTSGGSPALARRIRSHIEGILAPEYAELVGMVEEVRAGMLRSGLRADAERWQTALDLGNLLDVLRREGPAEAKQMLVKNLGLVGALE
jgi:siroheme synthase-like protein